MHYFKRDSALFYTFSVCLATENRQTEQQNPLRNSQKGNCLFPCFLLHLQCAFFRRCINGLFRPVPCSARHAQNEGLALKGTFPLKRSTKQNLSHGPRRVLCALLAAVFVLSLAGCGSGSASFTWFVDTIPSNLDPQVASTASDVIACDLRNILLG